MQDSQEKPVRHLVRIFLLAGHKDHCIRKQKEILCDLAVVDLDAVQVRGIDEDEVRELAAGMLQDHETACSAGCGF